VDDPDGGGARLAGELLSRQVDIFLYGLFVRDGLSDASYADECFDLIVSAGGRRSWPMVSRALGELHRLVRPGGTVAVTTPHPLTPLGRGLRRLPRPNLLRGWSALRPTTRAYSFGLAGKHDSGSGAAARDAYDIAVGHRLVDVFGTAVRTELSTRVVWRATRRVSVSP